ncbi:MAG: hypothetical protein WHT82_13440, partial [Limisphaera sp.]
AGTLTLAGTHTYTNTTSVQGGTLWVNGTLGPGPVVVSAGAALGGTGVIPGAVTFQAGAVCAPGANEVGRLTLLQPLSLPAGSTLWIAVDPLLRTQAVLRALGGLSGTATLVVTNRAGEPGAFRAGDVYEWFEGVDLRVTFASVTLPPLPLGLAWDTNQIHQGRIRVVRSGVSEPPRVQWEVVPGSGAWRIQWPAAYRGWILETNATDLANPAAWFPLPDSAFTQEWEVRPTGTSGGVFYRLRAP